MELNPIQKMFATMDDERLHDLMTEINACAHTGCYPEDADIRNVAKVIAETIANKSLDVMGAEMMIQRECAHRWYISQKI